MTSAYLFIVLTALLLIGCAGSKELEKTKTPAKAGLEEYERDFRPSDYDMDVKVFLAGMKKGEEAKPTPTDPTIVEPPIVVQGYRVQLFATSEFDDANAKKAQAEAEFADQWFYLVYDPPTYKLRAGNFLSRTEADSYARYLSENGYPDAWIVPERVVKNLQPRNISQSQEPEQPKQ